MSAIQERISRIFDSKWFNPAAFCIIAALILIAYSNTFTAAFHFDDNPSIVENPYIKRVTWDNFTQMLHGTRPVVNLSLMLNYAVSGMNVVGWHIFNIGFHIANSCFVFLLILWTLELPTLSQGYGDKARRMALFGALLFGLHPVQTEAVTYIISRTELLAAFFYLATILLFIKGATTRRFGYYFGALLTAALAMGSKEWAVTLPATLFLYDLLFLSNGSFKTAMKRWKAHGLVALSWGVLMYTMSTTKLSGAGFSVVGTNNITPWSYLLTSCNVLWTYIRLLFIPIEQNLDYEYPLSRSLFEFPTILSVIGHLLVIGAAIWVFMKRKWTLIPFGLAWFYITMSPTQSFVPILDVIFEHRVYLPSIGIFIAFIAAFEGIFNWFKKKKTIGAGSSVA